MIRLNLTRHDSSSDSLVSDAPSRRAMRMRRQAHLLQKPVRRLRCQAAKENAQVALYLEASLPIWRGPITGIADTETFFSSGSTLPPAARLEGESRALLGELLAVLLFGLRHTESILAYLADAEMREPDAWLRDDVRIAWLTVLHCSEGIERPWEYAFYRYLGKHPDKLIPEFVARAERHAAMESSFVAPLTSFSAATGADIPPEATPSAPALPPEKKAA